MANTDAMGQNPPNPGQNSPLIMGQGEMADLIRRFDWPQTPLGPVESWPDTLLSTVNTMLSCPQPMFLWCGPDLIQVYNDGYRALIGTDKHPEALGQPGKKCWPEIWHIIGPQIAAVMEDGTPTFQQNGLVPIYRNEKLEDVYWNYSYSPIYSREGKVVATLVVCMDTTKQVVAGERLRKSEYRFRRFIEEANIGVLIRDLNGKPSYINPYMLNLLGYTKEDFEAGRIRWEALTPEEFAEDDRKATEELMQFGTATPYEKAYLSKDGRRIPLLEGATLLADTNGTNPEVAVFLADLSALKRAESALLETEKLAAVGRLASSIAHEINNPLESVTNLLHLVEHDTPAGETLGYIRMAQEELARVANITRHTLRFHRQQTRPVQVTKAEILDEVMTLFRGRLKTNQIRIATRFSPARPTLCYSADLRQMFANFISNAADASPRGGRIFLREREGTDWKTGRQGIRVTVADEGHGMSRETIPHIFEPFFTTKEATGTGLGLWVSAGILKKHSAGVCIRSSVHPRRHGTVFAVWFPIEGVAAA